MLRILVIFGLIVGILVDPHGMVGWMGPYGEAAAVWIEHHAGGQKFIAWLIKGTRG
jgi:hypothetical protein